MHGMNRVFPPCAFRMLVYPLRTLHRILRKSLACPGLLSSDVLEIAAGRNGKNRTSSPETLLAMSIAIKIFLLAVLYFIFARFGLVFAFLNPHVTAVWPPTGIALAAMLVWGYRFWPGIALGALLVNLSVSPNLWFAMAAAAGNTLEAVLGALLIRYVLGRQNPLDSTRGIFAFVLCGVILGPVLSASAGVGGLLLTGGMPWSSFWAVWSTWWMGDAGGALVFAPLILAWREKPQWSVSAPVFFVLLILTGLAVFNSELRAFPFPITYILLPFIIWAAFRLGHPGVTLTSFLVMVLATIGTLHGLGPFIRANPNESLLQLQSFSTVFALMGLILTAAATERRRAEGSLRRAHDFLERQVLERTADLRSANAQLQAEIEERRRAERQLRMAATVFDNSIEGIMVLDPDFRIVTVNKAFASITGYAPDAAHGRHPRFLWIRRHALESLRRIEQTLKSRGQWRGEIWGRYRSGEGHPIWLSISIVKDELGRILNYVVGFTDITPLKDAEAHLKYLASHDPLTQLPNRHLFYESLRQALAQTHQQGRKLAVLFIDLDNFKAINDRFGHDVGDELLQAVAKRLQGCIRTEDVAARLGGDEFTVILREIKDSEEVAATVHRMRQNLAAPYRMRQAELLVTPSIGISCFPEDGMDVQTLLRQADIAMYHAKELGRNQFHFFSAGVRHQTRLELEFGHRPIRDTREGG